MNKQVLYQKKLNKILKIKKKAISEKSKQLYYLKNILKAAKNIYQEVTKENIQLKQDITTIKQQQKQQQLNKQQQQQQQAYFSKPKKYKKVVYEEASHST